MPCIDAQCAAVSLPKRWASSTIVAISSGVYEGLRGSDDHVEPPVAMILMKSAPSLTNLRTSCRTPSIPSASEPQYQKCPPVMVIGRPEMIMSGPSDKPLRIPFFRENATLFLAPFSRAVVTPASRNVLAFFTALISKMSSSSAPVISPCVPSPGAIMWVCPSTSPGRMVEFP